MSLCQKCKLNWNGIFISWGTGLLLLSTLVITTISSVKAAVTLLYFSAISENQQVRLVWETATELNNAGFFVVRSNQRDSGYVRINSEIIQSKGSDFIGATYEYLDTGLANYTQYWYKLESLDMGQHSQFSDPVRAVVGATATPSGAPTSTATRTPTPTATSSLIAASQTASTTATLTSNQTSGIQPTFTKSPTGTIRSIPSATQPYPGPGQAGDAGQNALATPGSLESPSAPTPQPDLDSSQQAPTATLIPFPTITIIFPESSPTATSLIPDQSNPPADSLTATRLSRLWPFGLLIAIWLGLVAWFYITYRRHH
jgi:hypothetical protein